METAIEWCDQGLDRIAELDLGGLTDRRHDFEIRRARLDVSEESTVELYYHALGQTTESNPTRVIRISDELWDRRETLDSDTDIYPFILAGGVLLAAHDRLFDFDEIDAIDSTAEDLFAAIAPEQEQLTPPANLLFEYLSGDAPDLSPEEMVESIDIDEDDNLAELEVQAYAGLLATLQDQEDETEDADG